MFLGWDVKCGGSQSCSHKPLKRSFSEPSLFLCIEQSPRQNTDSLNNDVCLCVLFFINTGALHFLLLSASHNYIAVFFSTLRSLKLHSTIQKNKKEHYESVCVSMHQD